MKKLVVGILAHVDAGKTTLSEGLLYTCGRIRKPGRVDHKDAYLDTFELERERGITIFSKQAVFSMGDTEVTLLDTPGHVDFSAEMERTLQVLDYAVLVISGADGVQGHTQTLWRLLERYRIPVFLFINKMDQEGTDRGRLLEDIKKHLRGNFVDFNMDQNSEAFAEELAVCDEALLESYLEMGQIADEAIAEQIAARKIFPCYFGSALKLTGVQEFVTGLCTYARPGIYGEDFGAKVYKIARDEQGSRLTYMKITGGRLKVKEILADSGEKSADRAEPWEEKVDQIRIYSGAKYELAREAEAGTVCAVTGLTHTYPGEGLGAEAESDMPVLEPVLNYQILLPEGTDVHLMLKKLKELEEEEPQLHIVWNEQLGEIHAMLMGEVQTEILRSLIWERFHVRAEFGAGNIVYKETIADAVEGVGHFEPLRHYAEVHLLLEPGERGSGLQFFTACSEDVLDRNWQRLILTHLEEREHPGVLTGSPITDMQITLIAGRAHLKHTEGGDFRQATYRAVRQGLKKAKTVLLEPYYEIRLEVPPENIGRAMSDLQKMQGSFQTQDAAGELAVISGVVPVAAMQDYQKQVLSYTKGRGRLFCTLKGYEPCKNQEEVAAAIGYDSERDLENPTGSVFCAHGAGYLVPWDQVEEHMHLEGLALPKESEDAGGGAAAGNHRAVPAVGSYEDEKELQAIFERTYGPVKRDRAAGLKRTVIAEPKPYIPSPKKKSREEYLLVDGYNIIFSWEELKELAQADIGAARTKLIDILCNYQGIKKCHLILVFDAYKVEGHREEITAYHNIYVVFTKEAETADQYIEKTVHKIGRQYEVTVATSDGLEQIIILGQGGNRLSAAGLKEEIRQAGEQARQEWHQRRQSSRRYLLDEVSGETAEYVKKIRTEGKN